MAGRRHGQKAGVALGRGFCLMIAPYSFARRKLSLGGLSMTNNSRDDPKHWLDRAAKARVHAEQMSDLESKRMMLGIVKNYEGLARRAEQQLLESKKAT